ncbi:MAG TPA: hypothetical protein VFO21_16445 [Vicinamibacterales bacterium]|nr:hypothetical protein [Vicinamibacterales bacterium]
MSDVTVLAVEVLAVEVLAVEAVLAVDAADPGATAGASGAVGEDADIGARALSPGAP